MKSDMEITMELKTEAEAGDVMAQQSLGISYASGEGGVRRHRPTAVKWYRMAAEQGDVTSQYDLAMILAEGWGVAQNGPEAVKWYRLAAEQGHLFAQLRLAEMYAHGTDIEPDYKEACIWYSVVMEKIGNNSVSERRESIAKKLSPAEFSAAQREAKRLHGKLPVLDL